MKILFLVKNKSEDEIMEELLKTEDIDDVIKVLSTIRDRGTFVRIIDRLLNILSSKTEEISKLRTEIKEFKKGEIELL